MESKDFERTFRFEQDPDDGQWYPIVRADFLTKFNTWITIALLFDTGATDIVLRRDYLKTFTPAADKSMKVPGRKKPHSARSATSRVNLWGVERDCTLVLEHLPEIPIYNGLFGRRPLFSDFGFGFWERDSELYVTLKP